MAGTLSIAGNRVKEPKEFSVAYQTIDSDTSGRNANGEMVRDIIAEKVKLECKWGPLSDDEIKVILSNINSAFFTVNYPDAKTGGQVTKTFYCGDRSAPSYSWNDKFKQLKWEGLSVNFIEK